MKLHLPKVLLTTVLAACFFSSQAAYAGTTGWGSPNGFDGEAYYINSTPVTIPINATEKTNTTIGIFNDTDSNGYAATVNTLNLKDGDTLKLVENPWHSGRLFDPLTIENLEIAGNGSAKIVNVQGSSLVLKSITGSLADNSETDPCIDNSGTLTLTGNLSGTGTVSVAGSGTFATGGNTIKTDLSIKNGATLEFIGTITMGGDKTLTFAEGSHINLGAVSFNNFNHEGLTQQNYEGGNAANGIFSTTVTLVSGGTIDGELTLSHKGHDYTINNANRKLTFSDGFYYLNAGNANLSDINTLAAESDSPLGVQMAANTTLDINAALASGQTLVVNGNSTAAIAQGISLSQANVTANNGAVLTLTGAGEYNNGNGATLNSVALGEGWTGNVIVDSARGVTDFNIDSFAKIKVTNNEDGTSTTSASKVTLQGVSGYLQAANNANNEGITYKANLILENSKDGQFAALEITDGYSGDRHTFAGVISGGGNFIHNKDLGSDESSKHVSFTFTNNISEWDGNIENVAGIAKFRFTGDATTINNAVIRNRHGDNSANNKMDIEFSHDKAATINSQVLKEDKTSDGSRVTVKVTNTSEAGTTFTNTVDVSKIEMTKGTKATFDGTTTTGELVTGANSTLKGTVTVSGTATLNGVVKEGSAIVWTVEDAAATKTLTLNTKYNTGDDRILSTIASGSTVNFGTEGQIILSNGEGHDLGIGKNLTLTATITLDTNANVAVDTRWLIKGNDIYYRDTWDEETKTMFNTNTFKITESTGKELTRYANAKSLDADWTLYGGAVATALSDQAGPGVGAYRYVATADGGIGVQYYQRNVPEPATATLSLLALAALAARRRRKG